MEGPIVVTCPPLVSFFVYFYFFNFFLFFPTLFLVKVATTATATIVQVRGYLAINTKSQGEVGAPTTLGHRVLPPTFSSFCIVFASFVEAITRGNNKHEKRRKSYNV
jgi:hypothetical protein